MQTERELELAAKGFAAHDQERVELRSCTTIEGDRHGMTDAQMTVAAYDHAQEDPGQSQHLGRHIDRQEHCAGPDGALTSFVLAVLCAYQRLDRRSTSTAAPA